MVRSGNERLPVEKDGRLIGIVTRGETMSFPEMETDSGIPVSGER
jgi:hypothetical protein